MALKGTVKNGGAGYGNSLQPCSLSSFGVEIREAERAYLSVLPLNPLHPARCQACCRHQLNVLLTYVKEKNILTFVKTVRKILFRTVETGVRTVAVEEGAGELGSTLNTVRRAGISNQKIRQSGGVRGQKITKRQLQEWGDSC